MSASLSKSFTAVGVGTALKVAEKDGFSYDVSGTFVGTVKIERSRDGGNTWEDVVTGLTTAASGSILNVRTLESAGALYRYQCTAFTSGTIVCLLTELPVTLREYVNRAGATIFKVDEDKVATCVRTVSKFITDGAKVGATSGATVGHAENKNILAKVPASQSASTIVIPLKGMKVGDTITGFNLNGNIISAGGTVTVDAALRSCTPAAAGNTDAAVTSGGITQLSKVANTLMSVANAAVTGLSTVVAAGVSYYLLVTVTTAGSTSVELDSVELALTEA